MRANDGAACDLFVTLVHGTWPRNVWRDVFLTPFYGKWPSRSFPKSLWFADGSEFRNRLTAALGKRGLSAQISPFLWSGANSVRERDKAAHKLVEHIRAKQSDYPSSTQVVIAHSHGGNVALRALDQLGITGDGIFIATIATPFVEILRTKLSPAETLRIYAMVSATTAVLIPQYTMDIKNTYFSTLNQNVLPFDVFPFIAGLLGLVTIYLFFRLRERNPRKVDELVGLTSLSPSVRKHPLLVLRALDDEASLTLAAAAIGNRLSRWLERLSYKIWALLRFLLISLIVTGVVLIAIKFLVPLDDFMASAFMTRFLQLLQPIWNFSWFDWLPKFARGLVLAFFAFLFSPGAFNSTYGRELFLIFQGCEINSQSVPDSIDRQSEFRGRGVCEIPGAFWIEAKNRRKAAERRCRSSERGFVELEGFAQGNRLIREDRLATFASAICSRIPSIQLTLLRRNDVDPVTIMITRWERDLILRHGGPFDDIERQLREASDTEPSQIDGKITMARNED